MMRHPAIRPAETVWHRLDAGGRRAFPAASAALVLVLLSAPLGLPLQSALRPAAALACVFFWSLHRPASMRPVAAFGLGLLADLLGSGPIGGGVIALLACQGLARLWRPRLLRQDPLVQWLAFCGVALLYAAILWSLDAVCALTLLPLDPALFEALLAAACYPLLALVLLLAHGGLADPEKA